MVLVGVVTELNKSTTNTIAVIALKNPRYPQMTKDWLTVATSFAVEAEEWMEPGVAVEVVVRLAPVA